LNLFTEKIKEVLSSVLPITIIVLILNFTATPLATPLVITFLIGAFLIMLGLAIFLIGVDISVTPLGNQVGSALAKSNKLWIVVIGSTIVGFFISIAEPGLIVLANQVDIVTAGEISNRSILIVVSIGMAIMVALGFIRILSNVPLYKMLIVLYGITFILALFTSTEFLAIAFDASGATTGILAVPFILALAHGVSTLKKDSQAAEEDSFGLVAIASVGAILSVMFLSILAETKEFSAELELNIAASTSIIRPFIANTPVILREGSLAILPLLIIFLVLQKFSSNKSKKAFMRMIKGFVYAFLGLFLFLVGANAGFMDVGSIVGYSLASANNSIYTVIIGFMLGVVTILAEPAVHVLTLQIENVTSGHVKRKAVLTALSLGVGLAVALSIIRIIIPKVQLWHYLLPGYIVSIAMTFFVPKLFVGIAFDAGGVATGPMTATFILAFTQGVAKATQGADILIDGFGMIATVALMPIITLQTLGFFYKLKAKKGGLLEDAQ
jgi:hypothetical protein